MDYVPQISIFNYLNYLCKMLFVVKQYEKNILHVASISFDSIEQELLINNGAAFYQ